jgi:hypothetical protein
LAGSLHRAFNGVKPEVYQLLEVLCINESNDVEPNLARDCTVTLAYLASAIVPPEIIPTCIDAVANVVENTASWKAKDAALTFLQVNFEISRNILTASIFA